MNQNVGKILLERRGVNGYAFFCAFDSAFGAGRADVIDIRRAVYTMNTIESLNMTLRKVSKNRSLFPNDEAVFKLLYLALKNISKRWTSRCGTGARR